jgi:hypothetical protein
MLQGRHTLGNILVAFLEQVLDLPDIIFQTVDLTFDPP